MRDCVVENTGGLGLLAVQGKLPEGQTAALHYVQKIPESIREASEQLALTILG